VNICAGPDNLTPLSLVFHPRYRLGKKIDAKRFSKLYGEFLSRDQLFCNRNTLEILNHPYYLGSSDPTEFPMDMGQFNIKDGLALPLIAFATKPSSGSFWDKVRISIRRKVVNTYLKLR
jgi:hypothetical protein